MNKYFSGMLVGAMLLAMNAWADRESPMDNKQVGQPPGTIVVEPAGSSVFRVDDKDFEDSLTIGKNASSLREGKRLQIQNRSSSRATEINVQNTNLASPLILPANSNVEFIFTSGTWVSRGVQQNGKPGDPGTGQVIVPPVSK
ncbi:hypothetical protein IFT48_09855 [Pseudomonas fluorescens]|uniref:hypothetical protein n=1 Tax=Pseudomonas fluorescens TaxID=294 RepID=UPI0019082E92|nr:hypothetical protein [Pseudomonas fluorescens]MBD8090287.1 hypothetical protein [Pseudomonas fluorescens]MBD8716525.1 hypothetical protein [Pseudomonas fluorescens]